MCGIIGYVGEREAAQLLADGLRRLEYRGYDSAGIATLNGHITSIRTVGNFERLQSAITDENPLGATGIGHTRWATHGRVAEENTHPLPACDASELVVVMNGIVENFRELREELRGEGHTFTSETDAEVISHLVERYYHGDLVEAVRLAYNDLEGHFAFVAMHRDHPQELAGARLQCPLVVGVGDGEMFISSSIAAFLSSTCLAQMIEDGEIVQITPGGSRFFASWGGELEARQVDQVDWDDEAAEKGGFDTFMLKEIHEQPEVVAETIGERIRDGRIVLDELTPHIEELKDIERIVVLACGTAYHAGVVGRYLIESLARVPVEPDIASEWRYRDPILGPNTLVIGISQSGETADTIAALRLARKQGARTIAITNMMGSQITREVDTVLYTRAGLEMGVAATKTFAAQTTLMALLGLKLAQIRGTMSAEEISRFADDLQEMPRKIEKMLKGWLPIRDVAARYSDSAFFLYLGRHIGLPIALEGALKLKEISYIPTEAYSAGEMKHGPIALLSEDVPVVVVATESHVYDKVVSNIQEVRARGAHVIAIASEGNDDIQHHADDVVFVPQAHPLLSALLAVVPLQLLAYEIARMKGLNVDQPRNLAKTVTVE